MKRRSWISQLIDSFQNLLKPVKGARNGLEGALQAISSEQYYSLGSPSVAGTSVDSCSAQKSGKSAEF